MNESTREGFQFNSVFNAGCYEIITVTANIEVGYLSVM